MSVRDYEVVLLSEAVSPVTFMSGTAGNEAIVARQKVMTPIGERAVPYLSGNAIRHRCVRRPGMLWLIREYGLAGRLTQFQLNFLLHGGNLTEGGGREDTARVAEFQRTWPLGRLLGGTLPDQILSGSLHVWFGYLVCEENAATLEYLARGSLPGRLRPAESFVSGYQYTRGDAAKTAPGLSAPAAGDDLPADSNLMIFSGQAVTPGAAFLHGFSLLQASEVELGALLWSLRLWQAAGGTVGGQAARGHGRLRSSLVAPGFDTEAAVAAYLAHARAVRDDAVAWLERAFAPRAAKAKGKGKANGKAEPGEAADG